MVSVCVDGKRTHFLPRNIFLSGSVLLFLSRNATRLRRKICLCAVLYIIQGNDRL